MRKGKTVTGQAEVGGLDIDYTANNVIRGKPPVTCWLAVPNPQNESESIVALMGQLDSVQRFCKRLAKSKLKLPVNSIPEVEFAIVTVGIWPEDKANAVVMGLSRGGKVGYRQWAKEYVNKYRKDPLRIEAPALGPEFTKWFYAAFINQTNVAGL